MHLLANIWEYSESDVADAKLHCLHNKSLDFVIHSFVLWLLLIESGPVYWLFLKKLVKGVDKALLCTP